MQDSGSNDRMMLYIARIEQVFNLQLLMHEINYIEVRETSEARIKKAAY